MTWKAKARVTFGARVRKSFFAGLLTIFPLWVTYLIISFLVRLLYAAVNPIFMRAAGLVEPHVPALAAVLEHPVFQVLIAIVLMMVGLCVLGFFASRWLGRTLIGLFEKILARIPVIKTIYGSVKKLVDAVRQQPSGDVNRVVLIDFPSPEMKTVGLVTRTLTDKDTGRELAAVYVPTTPNPTSGYLEIVPVAKLTKTSWSFDEAMTFIVSGGAVAPRDMNYDKSAVPKPGRSDV